MLAELHLRITTCGVFSDNSIQIGQHLRQSIDDTETSARNVLKLDNADEFSNLASSSRNGPNGHESAFRKWETIQSFAAHHRHRNQNFVLQITHNWRTDDSQTMANSLRFILPTPAPASPTSFLLIYFWKILKLITIPTTTTRRWKAKRVQIPLLLFRSLLFPNFITNL